MKASNESYGWLWLGLALMPLLFIAFLLPLTPQDFWWYLRLGQDIVRSGSVPLVDTYSFTRAGAPFFYQSWLAAVLFWKIYQTGGLFLTFLMRGVIVVVTYVLVWFLAREAGAGPRLAALLTFLSAVAGSNNWAFRPQLLTYPLFVLALFILWRWARGENKGLYMLPVLSLLWINLHGSFPLLFVLMGLALLFGRGNRKSLIIVLSISLLAILVNPHGLETLGYVRNMLSSPSNRFSLEWAPMVNRGWQANLFYAWLLLFIPLAAFSPRKLSLLHWAWFLAFGWLALSGMRYVIWFLFFLAGLSGFLVSGWKTPFFNKPVPTNNPWLNYSITFILLLFPLITLPGVREAWWPNAPSPYTVANPIEATNWLRAHPELDGPLFSDFSHSSYLIFALPSRPVWIDPRFELYPPEQWEKYSSIAFASLQWQTLLDREGINLVMLSSGGEPALIAAMRESDQWCEAYQDQAAVIFQRGSGCP